MKQPEDRVTVDWVGGETGKGGATPEGPTTRRGAYVGAVKIGADNQAARARTKLSQAEFAKLAGVSERTLRTWERGDVVSQASAAAILASLANLDHAGKPPRPVRYRDHMTGLTWSGRGLMPRWLKVAIDDGAKLAAFEVHQ